MSASERSFACAQDDVNTKVKMKKGLLIALLCIIADQVHKYIMIYIVEMAKFTLNGFPVIESGSKVIKVTEFFNLVMVWNKGVSFGMFNAVEIAAYQPFILILLSLAITIGLLFWLRKATNKWQILGIGLIVGGAVGNVIDRIIYGAVADFFDFHLGLQHWPAFNIADSCICVGVFILVLESFFDIKKKNVSNEKN